jgi:tetratricopeptide (TPR) repeat protein
LNLVLVGLLVLVLWQAGAQAQQDVWERHIRAGEAAYQQGNYGEAIIQTKAALEAAEAFGPDDPRLATALNNLAELYRVQGKYVDAEPLYRRSLAIREKVLGPEHPDVAASFNNQALLYRVQGRYADAVLLHKRALAIWEKALGPEHPNVAQSLANYAALLRNTGRTAEADNLEARAKAIRAKRAGQSR